MDSWGIPDVRTLMSLINKVVGNVIMLMSGQLVLGTKGNGIGSKKNLENHREGHVTTNRARICVLRNTD